MIKRLFVSISLPAEWQNAFADYCKQFSLKDMCLTEKENIHITTCFLGDTQEELIGEIKEKLKDLRARTEPFSLSFETILFAPPGTPPRMVWAVFQKSDEYRKLAENMQETLRSFLSVKPHEEIIPHATLARLRSQVLAQEIDIMKAQPILSPFEVRSVELVESHLDSVGVRHEVLETFLFGKSA